MFCDVPSIQLFLTFLVRLDLIGCLSDGLQFAGAPATSSIDGLQMEEWRIYAVGVDGVGTNCATWWSG